MWSYFFAWYTGAVYSNLIASMIWGVPAGTVALWHLHRKLDRHHREHMAALSADADAS